MAEELCTCCDLPLYSCGKAVEEQQRKIKEAQWQRALMAPGVIPAKWPGICGCGTRWGVGTPIRKTEDGWMNAICCPIFDG